MWTAKLLRNIRRVKQKNKTSQEKQLKMTSDFKRFYVCNRNQSYSTAPRAISIFLRHSRNKESCDRAVNTTYLIRQVNCNSVTLTQHHKNNPSVPLIKVTPYWCDDVLHESKGLPLVPRCLSNSAPAAWFLPQGKRRVLVSPSLLREFRYIKGGTVVQTFKDTKEKIIFKNGNAFYVVPWFTSFQFFPLFTFLIEWQW